jgi:DNA-binding CsgD family transcriptional regulator
MIYIYLLEFKDNTYYVGKTNNVLRRMKEHTRKLSIDFNYTVLDEIENINWKFWEQYWICQFKAWGFKLENKNNGGGGTVAGIERSKDCKHKISISLSNRNITWGNKITQSKTGLKHNRINLMPKHIIDTLPKNKIIEEYTVYHKSAEDISLIYNVSTVTILNLLKQNNIKPTKNKIDGLLKEQIINEYNKHYNVNIIAQLFGLSRITIKNHIQQWNMFKDQRKGGIVRENT